MTFEEITLAARRRSGVILNQLSTLPLPARAVPYTYVPVTARSGPLFQFKNDPLCTNRRMVLNG